MAKKKSHDNTQWLIYPDHKRPVTRRDFLAQGLAAFSAASFLPNLWATSAFGRDCGSAAPTASQIPFLVFDCAGGAALPANFLVGKQGSPENLLTSYDRLGWDPKATGAIDTAFGLPMATDISQIRQGIITTASTAARANLRMGSFCHSSQDDTANNTLSALSLVLKSGYRGKYITGATGTRNTNSGGNSQGVFQDAAKKPLFVSSVTSLGSAIGFGTDPFTGATAASLRSMLLASGDLSAGQLKHLDGTDSGAKLAQLHACAQEENLRLVGSQIAFDARLVTDYQQMYAITPNSAVNAQAVVFATVTMNVLSGTSGPGVLTFGGCDYHNNTQTAGDAKDLEIGQYIGRAIEVAHRAKSPLFFQLITDGGCSNRAGTRIWVSDTGERSMSVIGYYDPKGAPKQRQVQVGQYTDGQVVDRTTVIGSSPLKAGCAAFANYLKLVVPEASFEAEFNKVVPSGTFKDMKEVESLLIFG